MRYRFQTAHAAVLLLSVLAISPFALADDSLEQGKNLTTTRSKGNCLACHAMDDGQLTGNLGPPLIAMQARFPDRDTLREQIADATLNNKDSRMPPFGRHRILDAEEIELIIDYLYTL